MAAVVLLLFLLCKDISWKPGDSCGATLSSLQRYQPLCFLFCRFFFPVFLLYSVLFFSLCHRSSPLFSLKKNPFFYSPSPCFRSLFFTRFSPRKKILCLPFSVFLPPFSSIFGQYLQGQGERDQPCLIPSFAWGVRPPLHLVTTPSVTSNRGVACRTRPLCFLIMRRSGRRPVLALTEHVGRERERKKTRGKNQNFSSPVACLREEEKETVPSKNDIVLYFFFFWKMHETTSFCPKYAVSFKWKLAPKCVRFQVSPSIYALFSLILGFGFLQSSS